MHRRQTTDKLSRRAALPLWGISGLLVLAMVVVMMRLYFDQRPKTSDIPSIEVAGLPEIRFASSTFPAGELKLFRISGTGVILAAKRLSDHRVHFALSTCKACSREGHKSYARKNELFCGTCNQAMRFENDRHAGNDATGQCPLPEIPALETDGTVTVALKEILRVADQQLMK